MIAPRHDGRTATGFGACETAPQTSGVNGATKVVFAWPYLDWGGAQVYFLNLIRTAAPEFEVVVTLPEASSPTLLSYLTAESVRIETVAAHTDMSVARSLADRIRRRSMKIHAETAFRRHLTKHCDSSVVFHVDIAPWTSHRFLAALARRNHTFVTLHTRLPSGGPWRAALWRRRWESLAREPKFHLLTSNRDVRNSLVPYLGATVTDLVPVAYSGVDMREIAAARASAEDRSRLLHRYGVPDDRILVTAVGQFIDRKGCWTFLDAAASLGRQDSRLYFLWLGTSPLSEQTERRIEAAGAPSFRHIHAAEIGKSRVAFLKSMDALTDIFALPSLVEGLPLVLVEAMAMGKPTVSTSINAIPEAVEHASNGLLIAPGDTNGLAGAISTLAADLDLRTRLGAAARNHVAERFEQRVTSETTFAAYRAAAGKGRPTGDAFGSALRDDEGRGSS